MVGSLADDGDRWSYLDLTFAVTDGLRVTDVLGDWEAGEVRDLAARAEPGLHALTAA